MIPVVAGLVVGAKAFGLGGAGYAGYQGASYVYNGVRDWIDPSRIEKRESETLANLMKKSEEREKKKVQSVSAVADTLIKDGGRIINDLSENQKKMEDTSKSMKEDEIQLQQQLEHITPISEGLEQAARKQEETIAQLRRELQCTMAAFNEAQQQLAVADARLEESSKELAETKEQTAASKTELAGIREELTNVVKSNKEKDNKINLIENKVFAQEQLFKGELDKAHLKIEQLSTKNLTYKGLVKTLTEQLEEAQENKRNRPSSPSFFK